MLNGFVPRLQGWADWILVARWTGKSRATVCGESRWKLRRGIRFGVAHYDLAAIDPEFLGRGLWTALMFDGMRNRA